MNNILLYVICDTINILVFAGNFGVVTTYNSSVDGYYLVNILPSPYTIQDETIYDGNIISSG